MERNYMNNNFKDNGIIRSRSYNHSPSKLKDYSWSQTHLGFGGGDHHPDQDSLGPGGGVFSWPPRSYTCSFCKREFRSAQALGGHMNVHRRDRARLRQSSPLMDNNNNVGQFTTSSHPPPLNLNLRPNHFSPSPSDDDNDGDDVENAVSPATKCTGFSSSGPPLLLVEGALLLDPSSPRGADFVKKGARKSVFRPESLAGFKLQDGPKFLKKEDIMRLDLEIGVLGDHTKEEPDLELRLGC